MVAPIRFDDRSSDAPAADKAQAPPRLAGSLWQVNDVQLFATGTVRGQTWTEADIDAMVANGRRFADQLRPPVVVGHEEKQPLTDGLPTSGEQNTGEPAFGRVTNLRKAKVSDGVYLVGDLVNVPAWLASLIANRQYSRVSVELYDSPPDGLEAAKGPILRRVAVLGAEIPQIKTLRDLPAPQLQQFREGRPLVAARGRLRMIASHRTGPRSVVVRFAETLAPRSNMDTDSPNQTDAAGTYAAMTPEARDTLAKQRGMMLDELYRRDFDVSTITPAVPTELLADILHKIDGRRALDDAVAKGLQLDPAAEADDGLVDAYIARNSDQLGRLGTTPQRFADAWKAAKTRGQSARQFICGSRAGM